MKRDKTPKEMQLGDIGFAMKKEAAETKGSIVQVRKDIWLEIAEVLMSTDQRMRAIERHINAMLKKGGQL